MCMSEQLDSHMVYLEPSQNGQYKRPKAWLQVNVDKRSSELPPSISSPQSRNEILAQNLESSMHFLIETFYLTLRSPGQSTQASWTLNVAKLYRALISTCLSSVLGARAEGWRDEQAGSFLSLFWVGRVRRGWRAGSRQKSQRRQSLYLPASSLHFITRALWVPCAVIPSSHPAVPDPGLPAPQRTLDSTISYLTRQSEPEFLQGSCLGLQKEAGSVKWRRVA